MKRIVLAASLVALMAVAAEAQATLTYSKQNKNSSLTITVSAGSYSSYGYGYGFGYGGYGYGCGPVATPYSPGLVASVGGGTLTFGTRHTLPYGCGYGGGYGYSIGGAGGYYAGYAGDAYGYGGGYAYPPAAPPPAPASVVRPGGVGDRVHEHAAAKEIEEGRRRFRAGDYRGALDGFRSAVTADGASGLAHLYFAAVLAMGGDGRNAEKALKSALEKGIAGKASLEFRDEKERARIVSAIGKSAGEGSLAAAYALALAGDPERLKKLAEKDPGARKLLGP